MTPEEFVKIFKRHKDELLEDYLAVPPETAVGKRIQRLGLSTEQSAEMVRILDDALTDAHYSILLGLDGCANIGGVQQDYRIHTETGDLITTGGMFEDYAWEFFHNSHAQNA